jgi:hypothetical protein
MGERVVKVWAWIAAAHEGDAPVSIAALCRAAVLRLGVDGASVTAVSGPVAREPVCASDEVSARLEEFQFTMGEGPGADDFRLGSPMLIPELDSVVARAARALVDVATIGILQERAVRQQELVAAQLQAALHSRVMIEQAKGVLAERHHMIPDEAFLILRRYARNHNRPLTALAGDVIQGTADIGPGSQATTRPASHGEPEKSPGPGAASGPRS